MMRNIPIRRKLMLIILLTSLVVMILMRGAFFTYEYWNFRRTTVRQMTTLGEIIATNSTAALAFENRDDAREILAALRAERHIVAAALYDRNGRLFASYPESITTDQLPAAPGPNGHQFLNADLSIFQSVAQKDRPLGTLYLRFDTGAMMRTWFWVSVQIGLAVMMLVLLVVYFLSRLLQRQISQPILALASAAEAVSERSDYSVRAVKLGNDELGQLTDAFNQMLSQIQEQDRTLRQNERRFRALIEHSADSISLIDENNKVLYLSPAVASVEGYAPEELLGRNGAEHTHPDDLPLIRETVRQLVERPGQPVPVLWRRRHKDGRWLWLEGVATNLVADPAVQGIVTNYRDVTPRVEAEAALRRSREEFKTLFDQAPVGYHEIDAEGRIRRINHAELAMLGYQEEELLGRPVWEISAEPAVSEKAVRDKLRGQIPPKTFERSFRRKDGSVFPVLIEDRLVKRADGTVVGIRANVQDITEQKEAERARLASEARYRTLFEYAPDGIVIANSESYYLDANASICRMLGYSYEEFIGLNASDIVASVELEHIDHALSVLRGKSDYQREWQFRRKDGSTFPADVIATMMPDGNLLAMIRDITERRRAERAIRESEEHFRFLNDLGEATRSLTDANEIMAVMAKILGKHLGASRCAYADVHEDGEHFTIRHDYTDGCVSTVGTYQLSLFGERALATLRSGQILVIRNVDTELLPEDGGEMFRAIGVQAIIACPLLKEGVVRAVMAVHQTSPRDWRAGEITMVQEVVERCWSTLERIAGEEKIRQLNIKLEQRVIERTSQLEAANKELEAFSYSVSHDLRSPLRAVDGYSLAVLEDYGPQLPEEGRRYLQTIRHGAQRMGELIDDLLTFARLNRQELNKRVVDTGELVRAALAELGSPWPERKVEVRIGALPASLGDPALLKQVWINLLSNALKYTSKREHAVIEIGCLPERSVPTYYVRDNGTGFDMKYVHKLFGVFQRLHRAEDYEGTGVGLAIVQRIIHRHGGHIRAEAEEDRGATFYFTLGGEPHL